MKTPIYCIAPALVWLSVCQHHSDTRLTHSPRQAGKGGNPPSNRERKPVELTEEALRIQRFGVPPPLVQRG
ncbi:MAG: hypothetical protein IH897_14640 [Planctomycetes bacterium]|nr:hypothetical protein [Planctomycetota bacterium]